MNPGKKRSVSLGVIIILLVGGLSTFHFAQNREINAQLGTTIGKKAPKFSLNDLEGDNFGLEDFRGKTVVLNFMATWCSGCKKEMTHLNTIDQEYDDSKIAIISIDVDPSEITEQLKDFKQEANYDWKFAMGSRIGTVYEVQKIPKIYIIDETGIIRHKSGLTTADELKSEIENII